uniref:FANCG protein n=1 Tax=Cyanistes caeruleus TaxID=156563 RepID=A0A8C0TZI5_CYACU
RAHCNEGQNELLSMIKAWRVPPEETSLPLVQSAKDLKEILWTAAAFLQGLQELEAGNFSTALSLLQEAAGGFCSKKILAQIYTCLGCCAQRMVMTAERRKGAALGKNPPAAASSSPCFLMRTELLVHTPVLTSLLRQHHPSEVKYLLAQRCLQDGSSTLQFAKSHSAWLRTLQFCSTDVTFAPQVPLDGSSALPRIPVVFLEAASALEQAGRHQDAITVCEEVIRQTTDHIPRAELAGALLSQKESLCCLAWRAAGYLHQGWAWAKLGESKEAITQFSREHLEDTVFRCVCLPLTENLQPEVAVLQKIRLLSLIGRGTQFLELGRHKEALLDFQHSLQISPGKRLILVRNTRDFHRFILGCFAVFSRKFLCFILHLFRCPRQQ